MTEALLCVENLAVNYGAVRAVDGVSLRVEFGSVTAVIGPNAAGKSSIMNAIAGRLRSTSGRVDLAGESVLRLPPHRIAARGLVLSPQSREVFGNLTVRENLLLGGYLRRRQPRVLESGLNFAIDTFPILRPLLDQRASSLSGGEQQMLAVSRALMSRPKLLLLDEPSASLAPIVVRSIFRVISDLKKSGLSILLAEQNVQRALDVADRVYVLSGGRVRHSGDPDEVRGDPRLRAAYFGGEAFSADG